MMAREPAEGVFDLHVPLDEASKLERSEVHVPDAVVDFLQTHVFADADGGDVDPPSIPADAAVGADVAHFEPIGVFQRREFLGHLAVKCCSRKRAFAGPAPRAVARG